MTCKLDDQLKFMGNLSSTLKKKRNRNKENICVYTIFSFIQIYYYKKFYFQSKIIRVLNLWQKNNVFPPEVIQPLFDLADPNNPIHKELDTAVQQTNGLNVTASSISITASITKGW